MVFRNFKGTFWQNQTLRAEKLGTLFSTPHFLFLRTSKILSSVIQNQIGLSRGRDNGGKTQDPKDLERVI